MPFIVTPRRLDRFSELYHQLGGLLSSGLPLVQGVEMIRRSPPCAAFVPPLDAILDDLRQGYTFAEALTRRKNWLPAFDIALLQAGEKSGRLDACCTRLAEYYQNRSAMIRSAVSDMAYPAFLVLLVALVFPPSLLPRLVWQGDVAGFLTAKAIMLGIIGAPVLLFILMNQGHRGEKWRSLWEKVLHAVPLIGRARRSSALARLCLALDALLNAGVNALEAWPLAADASGSPELRRRVGQARALMTSGQTPGEAITVAGGFPNTFVSMYRSGELSGRLDQSLAYLHKAFAEESARLFKRLVEWTPRIVLILVLILGGYFVISFYLGYFGGVVNLLDSAVQGQ